LGGDEFAVIIKKFSNHEDLSHICNRVLNALDKSFKIEDKEIFISASIGVAIYPHDGSNVNTLFKNSDLAMYKAKSEGKNKYSLFSQEMNQDLKNKINLENNIRRALKNNEFELYYQPKIDIKEDKIIGVESLLRWKNNEGKYIPPSHFIPIAENSGFILDIDRWVFMQACLQIERWEKLGMKDQKISVNISGLHFKRGHIINTITEISNILKIPSGQIEIEITEGVFLEKIEDVILTLEKLRSMGISISIDDFGTGYSSLGYLKKLPIDRIKIDKSFVDNIVTNYKDKGIVQTIITMTKLLNLKVIAEGVETIEQLETLNQIGCYEIQGFYFAKPMPVEEYNKFFKDFKPKK
ncbi:MAG TPA: GGDEF domain-containing protein, partial [Fusobacteriaceae bacterium]|nr:GGDEF domain-containing protein [Fusobacteriaceae bacterium]